MKLHEKLRRIRQDKNLPLKGLYAKIKEIFGEKTAFTYRTLQRIQAGQSDGKGVSLYQISTALGLTLKELKQGTEADEPSFAECVRKQKSKGRYIYSKSAMAEILTAPRTEFLALELLLEPRSKTKTEKDPQDTVKFKKWVYILICSLTCMVGSKKYTLRKGDSLTFDSRLPHYFENKSGRKVRCIIIQNPRHI